MLTGVSLADGAEVAVMDRVGRTVLKNLGDRATS